MNTENVFPAERDHLPVEVAISLLTEPKARLTNRQRKNCKDARLKVYTSESPLRKSDGGETYFVRQIEKLDAEERAFRKLTRKCGTKTLAQLGKLAVRSTERRYQLQKQYEKLLAENPPAELLAAVKIPEGGTDPVIPPALHRWGLRKQQALALLNAAAEHVDAVRDAAEAEISHRTSYPPKR